VELPGISHFARRLDRLTPPTRLQRLKDTGARVAHRLFPIVRTPPRA
jgi:phytanoyl-CoA hydroxylase